MATLLTLVGRGEPQPKPAYHAPMVRLKEDRTKWFWLFVATFIVCSIAAFYFGGAGSGIYDVITQVHYPVPFTSHTLSLKEIWDAAIQDSQRHLWRNGTIVTLAALVVGILRYHPEKYLYAKISLIDRVEHLLRWPNIKYKLGADKRQAAIAAGEIEPDEPFWVEPHVDSRAVDIYQKVVTLPVVVLYSVVSIFVIWHAYYWLRDHGLSFLPYLGIPSAKELAGGGAVDKLTNVVTADWAIKVVFFLPLLLTTRSLRDSYHSGQRYLIECRIGKRVAKLERKHKDYTQLSANPPLHYLAPAWRTAYRYYADLVISGRIPVPAPMSRKAKRWARILFLVLTALFLFGHYWIWSHT